MVYEEQPTTDVVISKLQDVVMNVSTREEFNIWAYKWVQNFDSRNRLSKDEDLLYSYLIDLIAIDLEIDKGVYFHEIEEIIEWIEKIKNGKKLFK